MCAIYILGNILPWSRNLQIAFNPVCSMTMKSVVICVASHGMFSVCLSVCRFSLQAGVSPAMQLLACVYLHTAASHAMQILACLSALHQSRSVQVCTASATV